MPRRDGDSLRLLLDALAHAALAKLLARPVDVDARVEASAVSETAGVRLVIYVEGVRSTHPLPALRPIEQCALEAAPGPAEEPITFRQLARKAGYGYTSHFREAARRLVDLGLLVRVTGGIRRSK